MSLPKCTDLKLGHTAELNADVAAENVSHLAKHGVASEHEKSNAGLATYPYGAVGAHTAPRVYCVSLGEAAGVLVFNGIVIEGMLAAITKPLLEWTKVAACAERPVGVAFWKFGDAVANWLSRTLVPPPPPVDKSAARPLVLFDGVCLLCSTFVQFVLDHNADETITFAALQSAVGEAVLQRRGSRSTSRPSCTSTRPASTRARPPRSASCSAAGCRTRRSPTSSSGSRAHSATPGTRWSPPSATASSARTTAARAAG